MEFTLIDNWLDVLGEHPIFDLDVVQTKLPRRLKEQQTLERHADDATLLQRRTRVMAVSQTDLLVAVRSQIRVLSLTEFKSTWLSEAEKAANAETVDTKDWLYELPYKILDVPAVNFNVVSLVPSQNGRLLAAVGDKQLVVVWFPRQGLSSVPATVGSRRFDCRTFTVGQKYYDTDQPTRILKVAWHPLSKTNSHLLVLGTDNVLRMFDVSADIEEPEQSFDLSPSQPKNDLPPQRGISLDDDLDDDEEQVATFALGGESKDDSGWEPFTVFYALRNGHMYALCPVLPFKSVVQRQHMEGLACVAEAKINKLIQEQATKKEDNSHRQCLSYLFRLQYQWIQDMLESNKEMRKDNPALLDNEKLSIDAEGSSVPFAPHRQGPFSVDNDECLCEDSHVSDMLFSRVQPVNILSVAYTNGTLKNFILGSEMDAQWRMPIEREEYPWQQQLQQFIGSSAMLPKMTLHEFLKLSPLADGKQQNISLMNDPLYNDTFYAYHATGVHAVYMKSWIDDLAELDAKLCSGENTEETLQKLSQWRHSDHGSEVCKLVDSAPFENGSCTTYEPIVGMAVLTDVYLSYCVLVLPCTYNIVTIDLHTRRAITPDESTELSKAVADQLKNIGISESLNNEDQKSIGYEPILSLPAFEQPKELKKLHEAPNRTKIIVPADMGGNKELMITEATLRFLGEKSETVRRDIRAMLKSSTMMQKRLTMQNKEFERQLTTLQTLYDKLNQETTSQEHIERAQRVAQTIQKYTKLALRADTVLRRLMDQYQPELSIHEKEWIKKLKEIEKRINGSKGYERRLSKLKDQVEQLEALTNAAKPEVPLKNSRLTETQLATIRRSLDHQAKLLTDTTEKVHKLQESLDKA
ncbi:uncharacterized protein BYT42DRAFT_563086 [Radiomyces spectabilis]|uniref:uncharacterized protein n=1 Tax=Radiomyces spectabilis TaxID=64574 RepID=UPI002220FA14|nr:uncharacterized protein BYT42DRAFT_563086 [Radiomyces spectabilis]KAI8384616.1 hypothetical protein BYT42DRAFT_563086 [Radiomyces spectabilis]